MSDIYVYVCICIYMYLGKTSTLIQAIVEVNQRYPRKTILACAPSDAAADVLCKRLSKYYTRDELFRLNWWQRLTASVPVELLDYCCLVVSECMSECMSE